MRTTVTLDDDVVAKLKAEMRRGGGSFKSTLNEVLRLGLHTRRALVQEKRFRIVARDLGRLRPGLSLDNVAEAIEQLEGPVHR